MLNFLEYYYSAFIHSFVYKTTIPRVIIADEVCDCIMKAHCASYYNYYALFYLVINNKICRFKGFHLFRIHQNVRFWYLKMFPYNFFVRFGPNEIDQICVSISECVQAFPSIRAKNNVKKMKNMFQFFYLHYWIFIIIFSTMILIVFQNAQCLETREIANIPSMGILFE
eukprot:NODE_166_length_14584_cov_1.124750.p10 type:complete len:169 gc:universal NODE_166_length_14584_cov_1.124750:8147-8653(+)